MNYTVVWTPQAENDLSSAWQAAHRLDLALERHPLTIGLPRDSSVNRTAVDLPLGIDYEVIEDDKVVRVI
jgi:hypothetical protein